MSFIYDSYLRNFLQVSSFYQKLRTPNRHAAAKKWRTVPTKVASAEAKTVANLANAAAKTREIPRPPEASINGAGNWCFFENILYYILREVVSKSQWKLFLNER